MTPGYLSSMLTSPQAAIGALPPPPLVSQIPDGVEGYLLPPNWQKRLTIDEYKQVGGYQAVVKAGTMEPKDIAGVVKDAGLRGRGGAGFATGLKWTFMPPPDGGPRYLAVNADESEPGTFKDRQIMERNPHLPIEGIMIASMAIQANAAFIYIRGEYIEAHRVMQAAIADAYAAGILGEHALGFNRRFDIHIQRGAGAYICGEESGMLESMEGKKAQPRKRPPFPAVRGLWQRPTTVENIETCSHVPIIIERGAEFFHDLGAGNSRGTIPFQLAGNAKRPGLIETSMGVTLREIVYDYGGGTASGRPVRAVQVGGPLGAYFTESMLDVALDFESIAARGGILGHGGIVVFDDTVDMAAMARYAMEFCAIESCGKCTPCRIGSIRGTELIDDIVNRRRPRENLQVNLQVLRDLCDTMKFGSLCALGGLTPLPVLSALKYFPEDFGLAASDVDFIGDDLTISIPGTGSNHAIA